MHPNNAKFITFEGGEGSGKSTNISYACKILDEQGIDYVLTREPGGTPLAEQIRGLLLQVAEEPLDAQAELLLIFAARAQHIAESIQPALSQGRWVVCDRFTDATYAYQGMARKLGLERVDQLKAMVHAELSPDRTFLLDVDPEVGRARAIERGELDRFEREPMNFHQSVREAYLQLAKREPERFFIVDASKSISEVQNNLRAGLAELIANS